MNAPETDWACLDPEDWPGVPSLARLAGLERMSTGLLDRVPAEHLATALRQALTLLCPDPDDLPHGVEARFVPTPEWIRQAWLARQVWTCYPERHENQLGVERFLAACTHPEQQ